MKLKAYHTELGMGVLTDECPGVGCPMFIRDADGQPYGPEDAAGGRIVGQVPESLPRADRWRRLLLAAEIREMRGALGLSQAEFAERAGVSTSSITSWERGMSEPLPALLRAVRALGTTGGAKGTE
jgi:DNA-binding XRE family transcriptional regulator